MTFDTITPDSLRSEKGLLKVSPTITIMMLMIVMINISKDFQIFSVTPLMVLPGDKEASERVGDIEEEAPEGENGNSKVTMYRH